MPSITKVTVNVGPSTPFPDGLSEYHVKSVEIEFDEAVKPTSGIFPLTVNIPNGNQVSITEGIATLIKGTTSTYSISYSGGVREPESIIGKPGHASVTAGSMTNSNTPVVVELLE